MKGDVVCRAAFDLILGNIRARVMGIALMLDVAVMHADDRAADPSGFRVPAHAITDFERVAHNGLDGLGIVPSGAIMRPCRH